MDVVRQGGMGAVAGNIIERWFTPGFRQRCPAEVEAIIKRVPGTKVHAYLGAFAEAIIQEERQARGIVGENDSGYGRL